MKRTKKIWPPGNHILFIHKSSSSELKTNFHVNPAETFSKIDEKLTFDLILALFGVEKGPKIWAPWTILYTFLEAMAKTLKHFPNFDLFWLLKIDIKNQSYQTKF